MNTPCMYCYATAELCEAEDPHGFVCTRATGHGGDHAACDGDDHPISTWPQRGETTGEVLARLQATLARLLDEADAELRDEADGGVAAALIEKEAEARATTCTDKDAHLRLVEALETIERLTRERDEARAAMTELAPAEVCVRGDWFKPSELPGVLGRVMDARDEAQREAKRYYLRAAESRPLTPDAITDEMVGRGRTAYPSGSDRLIRAILTAALTESPARPEGAEQIEAIIADQIGGDVGPATIRNLADRIATEGGAA